MKRSLRKFYLIGVGAAMLVALCMMALLVALRLSDVRSALHDSMDTIAAWTLDDTGPLQAQAERIAAVSPPVRVTFLMDSGLVLADSETDTLLMRSHAAHPEVQQALRGTVGESFRLSETSGVMMIYLARRIAPNLILRLSYPADMVTHALLLYCAALIPLLLAVYLIYRRYLKRFTQSMLRQMDDVRRILENGTGPEKSVFPELQPAMDNIAYLAQRLNTDLDEVNRTLRLRNDFVANASHELRSPLTSIMGFAEMMEEGLVDTPEEQALCLSTIRSESARMLEVVDDVLLLSRAERQQDVPRETVQVERVAQEIIRALSPQAAQKEITLSVTGSLALEAAEKDIWEILHNLMSNAIRYGRHGGCARIALSSGEIAVEDDGPGIAGEHLPHLFEQFYRVDQSRDAAQRGTGLGLSIVRTLAARNGGAVSVESEVGRGSRFTIRFSEEVSP